MKESLGSRIVAFPAPAWAIGSYNGEGSPNIMTAAWAGICCSKPFSLAVCIRPATSTYDNIVARQAFTVSIPSEDFVREIDYIGLVTGKKTDKFADTGLTAVRGEHVDAPYVDEFPLVYECRVTHQLEIGLHTLFVGEVADVKAEAAVLNEKGAPDMAEVRPVIFGPDCRTYHGLGEQLGRAFSMGKEVKPEMFTKKED